VCIQLDEHQEFTLSERISVVSRENYSSIIVRERIIAGTQLTAAGRNLRRLLLWPLLLRRRAGRRLSCWTSGSIVIRMVRHRCSFSAAVLPRSR
jgi:hypothetical protein